MPSSPRNYVITSVRVVIWISLLATMCAGQSIEFKDKKTSVDGPILATTSTLAGTIVDQNNDVIPNAGISIKDSGGTLQRDTTSAEDGSFQIKNLPPTTYTVVVQREGFSTTEVKNVVLDVSEQISLTVQLRVGVIGETVSITAERLSPRKYVAPGVSLERQAIENAPLNGRSLQNLILLAPGTVATRATFSEQGQLSSNGQRANANYFMLDGVSANIGVAAGASGTGQSGAGSLPGLSVMGTTNTLVSIDSLQEVKVLTSAFAPEFGRTPGAQVLLTTRGGTNGFHGSLFEYYRSDAFGSRDWFAHPTVEDLPATRINNFGGVFGGPIIKNKTYFFFSYEGLKGRLPNSSSSDVPSIAARQGAQVAIRPFLSSFPVPNGPVRSNPALAEFSASYLNQAQFNAASIRLDQIIGDRFTIFARYNYAPSEISQRGAGSSLNNILDMSFKTETFTIGATQVVTPSMVNDFRFNYSRSNGEKVFELDDFGGAIPIDRATLLPTYATLGDSFYSLTLGGNTSILSGRDASSLQDQFNVVDNLSMSFGRHQLRMGFDYRKLTSTYEQWKYRESAILAPDLLSLQYGNASQVSIAAQDRTAINFLNLSLYAQDTWRITPRLSVTYGLRWDYNPAPAGDTAQSLFTVSGLDDPSTLDLAPQGTPLYKSTYNNFAPRVGVAFQLSDRQGRETMLRGGFGVFYDLGTGPLGNSASSFPYQRRVTYTNIYYPLSPAYRPDIPYSLSLPVDLIRVAQPDLKLPRILEWNFGIEQSLGSDQTLTATYVGSTGDRLLRTESLLNPNPYFGQVFVTTNKASSSYNALQLQFQRRLSKGFQAYLSYTWAHSIDIASNDSSSNLTSLAGYDVMLDNGPSDFDVRHSVSASIAYDIPALLKHGIGKMLFRDWSIETMINARTAAPVEVFSRRNSQFGQFNLRPDLVQGVPTYVSDGSAPGGQRLNPDAFVAPSGLRQGTLGRNSIRGFPFTQVDLGLFRRVSLNDRIDLQFRIEVFNLFNHPNFGVPSGDLSSDQFGRATAMLGRSLTATNNTGFNPLFQAGGPRAVQFGLKLQF